jgi:hypothetical protein
MHFKLSVRQHDGMKPRQETAACLVFPITWMDVDPLKVRDTLQVGNAFVIFELLIVMTKSRRSLAQDDFVNARRDTGFVLDLNSATFVFKNETLETPRRYAIDVELAQSGCLTKRETVKLER